MAFGIDSGRASVTGLVDKTCILSVKQPLDSLPLNTALPVPAHLSAIDIQSTHGGYHSEFCANNVAVGAICDLAVYVYSMGRVGP